MANRRNIKIALNELAKLASTDEAIAVLDALEARRKDEQFVRYWDPTAPQKVALAAFTPGIKIFAVLGGNRSGKTELGAAAATAWALGKDFFEGEPAWAWVQGLPIPPPPNNIWVVGLDFPTLRDVIWREKLRKGLQHAPFLPKDPDIVTKTSDSDFQVFFANGSVITGKSADSGWEKFQGASVNLVWIDEECEEAVYNECYQRTVDCEGKILVTLTPLTDIASGVRTPWVFDLHKASRSGASDIKFVQLSVMDNPFVPQVEKDKLLEKWAGHPEEKARLYGEFIQRSGLVYNTWTPEKHLVKPFAIPHSWTRVVSIDPAATGVTAALWGAVDPHGNLFLYREYYQRDLTISEHAKSLKVLNSGDQVDIWLLDPFFGAQKNAETHRTNLQIYRDSGLRELRLAPREEDYGLNVSREYINATVTETSRHPKLFVFDDLGSFRWEIEQYTWARFSKGEMKGLSKEHPTKRNDHLMNAMQYMCSIRPRARLGSKGQSPMEATERARFNSYTAEEGTWPTVEASIVTSFPK